MTRHVTAYLGVRNAAAAIDFYTAAFDAVERYRLVGPDGSVMHAEMAVADSTLMLADVAEAPNAGATLPFKLVLDVADCDDALARALAAGATLARPAEDQFHGHRQAVVRCPHGYEWFLSEQREALPVAEIQQRFAALFDSGDAP